MIHIYIQYLEMKAGKLAVRLGSVFYRTPCNNNIRTES
jgi:hypothetical protein